MSDETITESVHGYDVTHDDRAESGADYLERLSRDEAEVFFGYAKEHGEAEFRDGSRKYVLKHIKQGDYLLERK